ncbi:MaoC family dehydratase N-terminal domain-containing protein [Mycobacterium sp. SM1]|uniref:FAS1-like dehydratase domain-containing protein n=1 Tax=Mycobacterium sp. SM1 TaxID=2816243 RepID=UPI001BD07638|nr:MaoC family dehydratase N-terminal domain-containing protein [Mycobacterium sp. SM1]MBS4728594.1 MaoC family dehydratase N-terminal domain-containing protein [Mycobacterium sp. SM1]
MNLTAKGEILIEVRQRVEPVKLAEVAAAIGTESADETARLTPYFGPTVAGEQLLVDRLGLDLSRALLAGQSYEWQRPFEPQEAVTIRVYIDDVYEKGSNTFGVVATEIRAESGELVQQQRTTFIEATAK